MYLLVAGTMFAFTACGGGETATEETATEAATEVAVCTNTGEPCLGDHSCCVAHEEVAEDAVTHTHEDGTEHSHEGDEEGHTHDAEESHEGHDHE